MIKNHILNPATNRMIKTNTSRFRRMVKQGIFTLPEETPAELVTAILEEVPVKENISVKEKIIPVMIGLVESNKSDFLELNEIETTKLLRRLLLERLAPEKEKNESNKKKKKKKPKKKLRKPESSGDSSDSD